MSSIANQIITSQDRDGMLRRALERIIQLYTDKSHFVYELLQNAEDAGASCIRFEQYDDRLEVLHNGSPFTSQNLQGLCDIGRSDKIQNLNQIGEFGVGFKSVFGICDTVDLYSEPSHYRYPVNTDAVPFAIRIFDFTQPQDIEAEEMSPAYTTRFVFPFTVGRTFSGFTNLGSLRNTLSGKLQNLGITTLLFMKNLELIEYCIIHDSEKTEGEYILDKQIINDHFMRVSSYGKTGEKTGTEESYLVFSRKIDDRSERTVDIAFPFMQNKNGKYECKKARDPYVSVYFPTETESKLNFIVQGPYRTTPNRTSIPADDVDNIRFAALTAELLRDAVFELKEAQIFNMSFMKFLPLSEKNFENYSLFLPLFDTVKKIFAKECIIPCKSEGYTTAARAKIARQEKLANLIPDQSLTKLINRPHENYHWLPANLTETNREYEPVFRFLTSELKIGVIRPEDIRIFLPNSPDFLPSQSDSWLVAFYTMMENVGAAFSKSKNETNMLTAPFVKTSRGSFVEPYRKNEDKQYVPNVFLPDDSIDNDEIFFVDKTVYTKCRHFFEDILGLQKPNKYELGIRDIRKRYVDGNYPSLSKKLISDTKFLLKYIEYPEYSKEVKEIISDHFVIRCNDGVLRNPNQCRVYLPETTDGINLKAYFANVGKYNYFADANFYSDHDIFPKDLVVFGVRDSIEIDADITSGVYDNGSKGNKPKWNTYGSFRWKLSLESIKDVLVYIALHPDVQDSILKSKILMKYLLEHEAALTGTVVIGGSTANLEKETCELLKILCGERSLAWNGKWVYTNDGDLTLPKKISKHELCTAYYGQVKEDSTVYELLHFKKTDADKVDDIKKNLTVNQVNCLFDSELRRRYGMSAPELAEVVKSIKKKRLDDDDETDFSFPVVPIKNWETLRKHAAEMMLYADPVSYVLKLRSIRKTDNKKEVSAYISNMYHFPHTGKYACQLCHKPTANIDRVEIFKQPKHELYPMYLCLCPDCAATYKKMRNNKDLMKEFRFRITERHSVSVTEGDQVIISLTDPFELWFTQTHFAEVQELLKLTDELEAAEEVKLPEAEPEIKDSHKKGKDIIGAELIGKHISRKTDGFSGTIEKFDGQFFHIRVLTGAPDKIGNISKFDMKHIIKEDSIYTIE